MRSRCQAASIATYRSFAACRPNVGMVRLGLAAGARWAYQGCVEIEARVRQRAGRRRGAGQKSNVGPRNWGLHQLNAWCPRGDLNPCLRPLQTSKYGACLLCPVNFAGLSGQRPPFLGPGARRVSHGTPDGLLPSARPMAAARCSAALPGDHPANQSSPTASNGAGAEMLTTAATRSGSNAAQASACGPPPE
jgi:hypothetical protein